MKSGTVEHSRISNASPVSWRKWLPLTTIIVVMVCLYWLDSRLKHSEFNGYAAQDATWSVGVNNVGAAWDALTLTDTWQELPDSAKQKIRESEIEFRKNIGVRISPERWNAWLGKRAVFSSHHDEIGVSFRPGLLFYITDRLASTTIGNGIRAYSDYFYTKHNDHIILSKSQAFIHRLKKDTVQAIGGNEQDNIVAISSKFPAPTSCIIHIEQGFAVEGKISHRVDAISSLNVPVSNTASDDPLTITGAKPYQWFPLIEEIMPDWPSLDLTRAMLRGVSEKMAPSPSGSVWVLDDINSEHFLTVPLFTIAQDAGGIKEGHDRWGALTGRKKPWFGQRYELSEAWGSDLHLMTNESSHMFDNESRWASVAPSEFDVIIVANYATLSTLIHPVVMQGVENDFIKGVTATEVDEKWALRWEFIENLGHLKLQGKIIDDVVEFTGYLNANPHE